MEIKVKKNVRKKFPSSLFIFARTIKIISIMMLLGYTLFKGNYIYG